VIDADEGCRQQGQREQQHVEPDPIPSPVDRPGGSDRLVVNGRLNGVAAPRRLASRGCSRYTATIIWGGQGVTSDRVRVRQGRAGGGRIGRQLMF